MNVVTDPQRRKHFRKSKAQLVDELIALERHLAGQKGEFQGLATIATDITGLKASQEEALQGVESKFRDAIESIPNGVAIFDKNDRFVLCNKVFHRNIEKLSLLLVPGTSFEEILAAVAAAGIEPDVRKDPEGYIRQRLDMRRRRVPYVQHMSENDTWTIIHDYEMADGNTLHVRTDITEQKRAEEALRENKEGLRKTQDQLDAIISNLPGGIFRRVLRTDGTEYIEYYMGQLPRALGLESQLGERSPRVTSEYMLPQYRKVRDEAIRQSAEKMAPCIFEFPLRLPDKTVLWVQSVSTPHRRENGEIVWDGINLDITNLKETEKAVKESEALFHNAIENLQEGFALFDKDDRLVIWNDKYWELLALKEESVTSGAAFEDLLRENVNRGRVIQSVGRTEQFIRERMEHHKNPSGPFELTLDNGKSLLASEAKTPDGGTYITLMDVTKLKQTEQRAREREVELSNSRRLNVLGEMAAAVAHELNQPLAVISSYAQGLADKLRRGDASPDDLLKPVENIVDQANRAGGIISGIRSLIGKQEVHKSSIDLNAAIEEVLVLLQAECEELGIKVTADLDQGLPRVMANKIQIQQVVLNLARNAIEAISEGPCASPRLMVSSIKADGSNVEVTVRDTGPGFSANNVEAIFEPFHSKKPHGLGLGLSICRSITEAYGGRIWIDPASTEGATIRFSLPVAEPRQL